MPDGPFESVLKRTAHTSGFQDFELKLRRYMDKDKQGRNQRLL